MPGGDLTQYVKNLAASAGFDRCGVARAGPLKRARYLRAWLAAGRSGSMEYLHRHFRKRVDPGALLDGAKSVIVVALLYHQKPPLSVGPTLRSAKRQTGRSNPAAGRASPDDRIQRRAAPDLRAVPQQHRGRVAMYAWGDDYHGVVKAKLLAMAGQMRAELAEPFEARACVDTAPLLERELAAAAGIGWIGKNTMVLDHQLGSYFFLGALVTTLELTPDQPLPDRCGTCTACLEACPTNAFPAPYEMDASRCISYLTIEHRGEIPDELQPMMGDWIFGCDVCQQVCPYNRRARMTTEPRFAIRSPGPRPLLDDILRWSIDDYRAQLRGSAMIRAKLEMLQRNARIAKSNAEASVE